MNKFDTKVSELLFEDYQYEYSCVMCWLTDPILLDKMKLIIDSIPYSALTADGREDSPHVTALYGIHTNDIRKIKEKMASVEPPVKFKFKGLSLFENEDFDVLKFDIESEDLTNLNKSLSELEHTNSYKDYHPHMTIAYVKSGMGKRFLRKTDLDGVETESELFEVSLAKSNDQVAVGWA